VTRVSVQGASGGGGSSEDGLRSFEVNLIASSGRTTGSGCGSTGGDAGDGSRSLVCALKVDLIDSDFDPGRATGSDSSSTVT
jgi:hypothetical protein